MGVWINLIPSNLGWPLAEFSFVLSQAFTSHSPEDYGTLEYSHWQFINLLLFVLFRKAPPHTHGPHKAQDRTVHLLDLQLSCLQLAAWTTSCH